MNTEPDRDLDELFEERLARIPLRKAPAGTRERVLGNRVGRGSVTPTKWGGFLQWVRGLLWPNPVAWGCVAAAWVVILGSQLLLPGGSGSLGRAPGDRLARKTAERELLLQAREQRALLVRLLHPASQGPISEPSTPASHWLLWNQRNRQNRMENV
jgi:hypothetical protein